MLTRFFRPALLTALLLSPVSHATTLLEMDIDTLVSDAELIFEGTVIETSSIRELNGTYRTYVTFAVRDVVKGEYGSETLELSFLGGQVNGRGQEVSDMRQPATGESGIYFVESVSGNLVNPLLGWSQGQFLIETDTDGVPRVTTDRRQPVLEIRSMAAIPASIRRPRTLVTGNGGRAVGVLIDETAGEPGRGLTSTQFKSRIRELLENQATGQSR